MRVERIPEEADGLDARFVGAGPIRAAGGVLWRPAESGSRPWVCLVHRPHHDDWSLPKGKLDPGEHPLVGAVREVREETGVIGTPQVRLPSVTYLSDRRLKTVDYWSMRQLSVEGVPSDGEVDEVRWLPVDRAIELVSYPQDAAVLECFAALPPVGVVLAVVRHARAVKRGSWTGSDEVRPLDVRGREQARALVPVLASLRPERLLAASVRRCAQTLGPTAESLDLPVEVDPGLDEPVTAGDLDAWVSHVADELAALARSGVPAAVCAQGRLLSGALDVLTGGPGGTHGTPKGAGWLLAFAGDRLTHATRF